MCTKHWGRLAASILAMALLGGVLATTASGGQDPTTCYNYDCAAPSTGISYAGGPIITNPVVYLVRFSASKTSLAPGGGFVAGTFSPSEPNAAVAARLALSGAASSWWRKEYSLPGPSGEIRPAKVMGTVTLYDPALSSDTRVSDTQIETELLQAVSTKQLPRGLDNIFVLFFRAGQTIVFPGSGNSQDTFCAYHSNVIETNPGIVYDVIPNQTSNSACGPGDGTSAFQLMTANLSHELTESVTDPLAKAAWVEGPATR